MMVKLRNVKDLYPLSPIQKGMLFHVLKEPQSSLYLSQLSCTLEGPLDLAALQRAWQDIVDRHEVLRTAFLWEGLEEWLQVVREQVAVPWELHDWTSKGVEEQARAYTTFLKEDEQNLFRLSIAPLMRIAVIKLHEEQHRLVWTHHHLILDGWSMALVLKDVFNRYEAVTNGTSLALPPIRPYRDYVAWLQQQEQASAEPFWRGYLKGFTSPTRLPVRRGGAQELSSGSVQTQRLHHELSVESTSVLRTLAQGQRLTLNTLVLGAWAVLLGRYSGQEDVLFGGVVSGRPTELSGVEKMVGLFINTLPVRVQIRSRDQLIPWLRDLQASLVEVRRFEQSPLVDVHGWSEISRGEPLFETILAFENYPVDQSLRTQPGGLRVSDVEARDSTHYPLVLEVVPGPRMALTLSYHPYHFDAKTVERLLRHLETLLTGMAAQPQARLCELPLLTPQERQLILEDWNQTEVDYSTDLRLHEVIDGQAALTPNAVAVACAGTYLTYRTLNERANQLAYHLRSLGVGPDVLVGLCLERSVDIVVGLFAIMKAGGAYVALDPTHPRERLAFIFQDAKIPVVITRASLEPVLPKESCRTVCLDRDASAWAEAPCEKLVAVGTADSLAYVIYTSGSTGQPKGVLVTHRNLTHSTQARLHYYRAPIKAFLIVSSLTFDSSVAGLFWTLSTGGTIVLPSEGTQNDIAELAQVIVDRNISHLLTVPSLYAQLLALGDQSRLKALEVSIVAGEELSLELVRRHHQLLPGTALFNEYGPTEATVWASVYETQPQEPILWVPIGRPIANTALYILDAHEQPVPVGVTGELYVGGAGVARGYLNRPELTEERFLPNPFVPGQRLYRSGDLARFHPDGQIEFLGRRDHQIKLRGYRIELGEIEQTLSAYTGVQQAVVTLREDKPGEPRLVAYVGGQVAQKPTLAQLRTFLAERLPSYMVPSAFVWMETFPLTMTGKIDRQALPAPDERSVLEQDPAAAPRSPVEQALVEIWRAILGFREIGIHDNFFALGGHSLLATQVASRAREAFQVELPLRLLFEKPTIAGLAEEVERLRRQGLPTHVVSPIEPVRRGRGLPLSFSQQRMWFLYQLAPEDTAYNMPATTRLKGPLNRAALDYAMIQMVQRHEAFRTTFAITTEGPVQLVGPSEPLKWEEVDLRFLSLEKRLQEATRLVTQEAGRPFDLFKGPPARLLLIQIEDDDHILVLNMHHIVGDQWSFGVIGREFTALYNDFCQGHASGLEPLPIQYADFAVWQRRWLRDQVLQDQLTYWREKLTDLPVLALPTDFPRSQTQRSRGSYRTLDLSDSLIDRLKRLSARRGTTLFMTLLAVFQILLSRYAGQEDIPVGSPIANRNRLATEGLVGTFVNTLVMRTELSGNPTFGEVLQRVRETALGAYDHQDLPFERLVEELQAERDLSYSPLVQVLFNVANAPMGDVDLDGLSIEPFEFDGGAAQFDLSLTVETEFSKKAYLAFRTDLFESSTIDRMVKHFGALLEAALKNPDWHISDLPILGEAERTQVLKEWNRTEAEYPRDLCLPAMFEAQVKRTPDATAVSMDGQFLTYCELNRRANHLAHYLRALGVGPSSLVGICLERSLDIVVGLLGILKAGGAYLSLDPSYPQDRIAFMVGNSGAKLIVNQSVQMGLLERTGARLICLDKEWSRIEQESASNPEPRTNPQDLAYVIYTSGSTGEPKGVEIQHQALVNFLWSMRQTPGLTERDLLLSVTTLSFDIAGLELYLPLIAGGRVELVSRIVASDGHQLKESLEKIRPTIMQATPTTWRMLVDVGWRGSPTLTALSGGEPLSQELAVKLLDKTAALWNMYGPTETTIWSTIARVERGNQEITIGRPIANTEIYVLDQFLQPVPIGAHGELYIGGDGLARGYRNRLELTRERFIPHPFSDQPGARLYKTGDVARYRADGQLIHLGRLDHQVKIRGFRIELGEIEATLARYPSVRQVVVTAREHGGGSKQLAAYLVPHQGKVCGSDELRTFLRSRLPEYMIPSSYTFLDSFPLTANNKINVKALPAPSGDRTYWLERRIGPRNALETQLVALWQQILEVQEVSIHDNFFDLGGHSLKAVQLFAHLEQLFGRQLPLATLFQAPTIAKLAEVLSESNCVAPWRSLVAIQQAGTAPPFFVMPGVGGNVLVFAKFAKLLGPNQPFYGLQSKGLNGKEEPFKSVTDMAAHYIAEIRSVRPHGPYFIGGTCTGGVIAYEVAQQLIAWGEAVTLVVMESWHPSSFQLHRRRIPIIFWPFFVLWSRCVDYTTTLARIPVADWPMFVREKLGIVKSMLTGKAKERLQDSTIYSERVIQATLHAVARYEVRDYPGRLLNLIASQRPISESTNDTRGIWENLAQGGGQTLYIPAEDSGRLFVSPHVEVLAQHVMQYLADVQQEIATLANHAARGISSIDQDTQPVESI